MSELIFYHLIAGKKLSNRDSKRKVNKKEKSKGEFFANEKWESKNLTGIMNGSVAKMQN